jgi:hypothetical protein
MNEQSKSVTLEAMEARRLARLYHDMIDEIMCNVVVYKAALELAKAKPATLEKLVEQCDGVDKRIKEYLQVFERVLALHLSTEPCTSPNGSPATLGPIRNPARGRHR